MITPTNRLCTHSICRLGLFLALAFHSQSIAEVVLTEDFETPDVTGYAQGTTPSGWVRHGGTFGAGRHGIIDKATGDFTSPDGNDQAYALRYTSSPGITTEAGIIGNLQAEILYALRVDVQQDLGDAGDDRLGD